jgi:hypothetical protein
MLTLALASSARRSSSPKFRAVRPHILHSQKGDGAVED